MAYASDTKIAATESDRLNSNINGECHRNATHKHSTSDTLTHCDERPPSKQIRYKCGLNIRHTASIVRLESNIHTDCRFDRV